MLFNSLPFALLVLGTALVYYTPWLKRFQIFTLIFASFIFYAWHSPSLTILLLMSLFINATLSYAVAYRSNILSPKILVFIGITFNLLILTLFKYGKLVTELFSHTTQNSSTFLQSLMILPLPIGISFYTFQGISLLVDTFRKRSRTDKIHPYVNPHYLTHLFQTIFYAAFFPHCIAGPIVKAGHFLPQIGPKLLKHVPWEELSKTLILGYFLKCVVADNLHQLTWWMAFPYHQFQGSLTNFCLLLGYSIQIFADFAGYSLIAIGVALLFGYQLPRNFDFPYLSTSLSEFWKRWHMSLSSWLRDYLYIPLGGNQGSKFRTYLNLFIVMTLGGLWHGAAWSYAIWGFYHGIGLVTERVFKDRHWFPWIQKRHHLFHMLCVFIFVSFGWVLFKLPKFAHVVSFLKTLAHLPGSHEVPLRIFQVFILSIPVILYHQPRIRSTASRHRWFQYLAFSVMIFLLILNSGKQEAFIYFQF